MCQVLFWALGEENRQILAYVDIVGDIDSTADIIITECVVRGKLPFKVNSQERPRRESDTKELSMELAKEVSGGRAAQQRAQQGDSSKVATCLACCGNRKGLAWLTWSERGPHEEARENAGCSRDRSLSQYGSL